MLSKLQEKSAEKSRLRTEIEKYRECDPEVIEGVQRDTKWPRTQPTGGQVCMHMSP